MVIISENSATVFSIAFFVFGIRRRNADKMWL
jgi:hypothetical protein